MEVILVPEKGSTQMCLFGFGSSRFMLSNRGEPMRCIGLVLERTYQISRAMARKRNFVFANVALFALVRVLRYIAAGVWADWSTPYMTLLPEYEAAQIQVSCVFASDVIVCTIVSYTPSVSARSSSDPDM